LQGVENFFDAVSQTSSCKKMRMLDYLTKAPVYSVNPLLYAAQS